MMNQQPFHEFRGSPYEIGTQHGSLLKNEIIAECEPTLQAAMAECHQAKEVFLTTYASRYQPWFERYVPRAMEEIHGIADGSCMGFAYTFFAATRDGAKLAPQPQDACTAFYSPAVATCDAHIYLGQTKDTNALLSRYHVIRRYYDGGPTVLTINYPGWIANIGMNSHGVACTGNSLYATPARGSTVPYSLMRYLIAEAQSVQQVEEQLRELPFENGCIMVADADGHAICIEYVAGLCNVRDISSQVFGHANSILSKELQCYKDTVLESPSSPTRQQHIQARLDAGCGHLSIKMLKTILADHEDCPHSICRHPAEDETIVTTAAFIADCTTREIHIAIGKPCEATFQKYQVS